MRVVWHGIDYFASLTMVMREQRHANVSALGCQLRQSVGVSAASVCQCVCVCDNIVSVCHSVRHVIAAMCQRAQCVSVSML